MMIKLAKSLTTLVIVAVGRSEQSEDDPSLWVDSHRRDDRLAAALHHARSYVNAAEM